MMAAYPDFDDLGNSRSWEERFDLCWREFEAKFQTDEDCIEEFVRRFELSGGIKCRFCDGASFDRNCGSRIIFCRLCKKSSSFTTGTFFFRMKLARPYLAFIWFKEHGFTFSSSRFEELLGISYSTALEILWKFSTAMLSEMNENFNEIPSSAFSMLFCKRSRQTPSRRHPVTEEEDFCSNFSSESSAIDNENSKGSTETIEPIQTIDDDNPEESTRDLNSDMTNSILTEEQAKVYSCLSSEPISFENLCILTGLKASELGAALTWLEIDRLAERRLGDQYVKVFAIKDNSAPHLQTIDSFDIDPDCVSKIVGFLRIHFHGISRKNLQKYLALCWYHFEKDKWKYNSLTELCRKLQPMSKSEMTDYVTPSMVKIPLLS